MPEDDLSSLERARERLYTRGEQTPIERSRIDVDAPSVPHTWKERVLPSTLQGGHRHVRLATLFLGGAFVFFVLALALAGYIFTVGGNTVSVDKVSVDVQGPTTIAGGDTVPLTIIVTNRNAVAIDNVTIEVAFPPDTRSAANVLEAYPRYTENIGSLPSGGSVSRSIKAVLFGGTGQNLSLPVSVSYSSAGSNAVFVKKSAYPIAVSTTPLSVSVDTLSEVVSGQPITLSLTVRSNATVPLNNVVLTGSFPFGFSVTSSSLPLSNTSFLIGTLKPGATKNLTLTGVLVGQDHESRTFRFTLGTASTAQDQSIAVNYMTVDAPVTIVAPFITTSLALNGDTSPNPTIAPGAVESVTLSYTNTLTVPVSNAMIKVTLSGSAVDYNSIQTNNGFYNSSDHSILFSRDTDPALASLAPGASGIGTFTFTAARNVTASPSITLTTSVSGTRVGQTNVPEQVVAQASKTIKVATAISFTASSLHNASPIPTSGPVPPTVGQTTTYGVVWSIRNSGSAVAGGTVQATLPSYVTYTGQTSGGGTFSYDSSSRTVTWSTGDLAQGASTQGAFQVALNPSSSQKSTAPQLTGQASFSGFDRFAGVQISASASPVTTETKGDPGYIPTNAVVQ